MLSVSHLIIIFVVALAVLGPEKLPKVAHTLGKAMAEFRRITGDFRYQIDNEMREMDRQTRLKEQEATIAAARAAGTVPGAPVAPYETAEESALSVSAILSRPSPSAPASEPAEVGEAAHPEAQKLGNAHS